MTTCVIIFPDVPDEAAAFSEAENRYTPLSPFRGRYNKYGKTKLPQTGKTQIANSLKTPA